MFHVIVDVSNVCCRWF